MCPRPLRARRRARRRVPPAGLTPTAELEAAVARLAGARPVSWTPVGGGHTDALRWRVELAGGGAVFVKAPQDDHARGSFLRELLVYESVRAPFLPAFVGAGGDPPLLVLEDLAAALWPPPWPRDVGPLFAALDAIAATPPPAGVPRIPAGRPDGTYWERIARVPDAVAALGACSRAWLDAALPALVEAEARIDCSGDELVHFDVWHANVCFAARGAVLVDWGAASVGNRGVDVAFALLALRTAGVEPPPVELADEGAWAAFLAGHDAWSAVGPLEEGLVDVETLRAGWLADLRAALPWAARLLGLPDP